ncbi:MAG: DNA-3-methyladenine glycosylase I [Planctomycetota bacterium]|jgi:DNA-3-methyladenine glycosylase I
MPDLDLPRCFWAPTDKPDYLAYHDAGWGYPVDDDRRLFEKLCLEGFQSGLSWLTILRKRENFRAAFAGFDFERVARYGEKDVERLLQDAGIVRHRGKIEATINNAARACEMVEAEGSLAAWIWRFEPDPSSRPERLTKAELMKMATSPESKAMSKELKKLGWRFVGPTTVYAFMQAMGLVNDHTHDCAFRVKAEAARRSFAVPGREGCGSGSEANRPHGGVRPAV